MRTRIASMCKQNFLKYHFVTKGHTQQIYVHVTHFLTTQCMLKVLQYVTSLNIYDIADFVSYIVRKTGSLKVLLNHLPV